MTGPVAAVRTTSGQGEQSLFLWCPGCPAYDGEPGQLHRLIVGNGTPLWSWDGNLEAPTVSPSLLVTSSWGPEHIERRCHSFIVNGQWQFLGDCTHALAGQTVDLPPLPDWFLQGHES